MPAHALRSIYLVPNVRTTLAFGDAFYEITSAPQSVTIRADAHNAVTISPKSQRTNLEASIAGGLVLTEEQTGRVDYTRDFLLSWSDEDELPELRFQRPPAEIIRSYARGQSIELGLEEAASYRVRYEDGVEALFERTGPEGFKFSFSTGLYGSFWKDPDGSYTLKFKGDRLAPDEDAKRSQSKFIVSRSKYSGNLLLVLQEDASVVVA
jgi:hypothetical protein